MSGKVEQSGLRQAAPASKAGRQKPDNPPVGDSNPTCVNIKSESSKAFNEVLTDEFNDVQVQSLSALLSSECPTLDDISIQILLRSINDSREQNLNRQILAFACGLERDGEAPRDFLQSTLYQYLDGRIELEACELRALATVVGEITEDYLGLNDHIQLITQAKTEEMKLAELLEKLGVEKPMDATDAEASISDSSSAAGHKVGRKDESDKFEPALDFEYTAKDSLTEENFRFSRDTLDAGINSRQRAVKVGLSKFLKKREPTTAEIIQLARAIYPYSEQDDAIDLKTVESIDQITDTDLFTTANSLRFYSQHSDKIDLVAQRHFPAYFRIGYESLSGKTRAEIDHFLRSDRPLGEETIDSISNGIFATKYQGAQAIEDELKVFDGFLNRDPDLELQKFASEFSINLNPEDADEDHPISRLKKLLAYTRGNPADKIIFKEEHEIETLADDLVRRNLATNPPDTTIPLKDNLISRLNSLNCITATGCYQEDYYSDEKEQFSKAAKKVGRRINHKLEGDNDQLRGLLRGELSGDEISQLSDIIFAEMSGGRFMGVSRELQRLNQLTSWDKVVELISNSYDFDSNTADLCELSDDICDFSHPHTNRSWADEYNESTGIVTERYAFNKLARDEIKGFKFTEMPLDLFETLVVDTEKGKASQNLLDKIEKHYLKFLQAFNFGKVKSKSTANTGFLTGTAFRSAISMTATALGAFADNPLGSMMKAGTWKPPKKIDAKLIEENHERKMDQCCRMVADILMSTVRRASEEERLNELRAEVRGSQAATLSDVEALIAERTRNGRRNALLYGGGTAAATVLVGTFGFLALRNNDTPKPNIPNNTNLPEQPEPVVALDNFISSQDLTKVPNSVDIQKLATIDRAKAERQIVETTLKNLSGAIKARGRDIILVPHYDIENGLQELSKDKLIEADPKELAKKAAAIQDAYANCKVVTNPAKPKQTVSAPVPSLMLAPDGKNIIVDRDLIYEWAAAVLDQQPSSVDAVSKINLSSGKTFASHAIAAFGQTQIQMRKAGSGSEFTISSDEYKQGSHIGTSNARLIKENIAKMLGIQDSKKPSSPPRNQGAVKNDPVETMIRNLSQPPQQRKDPLSLRPPSDSNKPPIGKRPPRRTIKNKKKNPLARPSAN